MQQARYFDVSTAQIVPTQEGYDRWAEFYDGDDNPLVTLEEQHIEPLLGEVRGLKLADIGCGTGRQALRLAARGAHVTGLDFSKAMLEKAGSKPGAKTVTFIQHDLTQPFPLETDGFDLVLSCLVLDHIPDLDSFFSELARLCRPTGAIVLSVMHPAMELRGAQARFIDPETGRRIGPASHSHQVSDYVMASLRAGLRLDHISEHIVDDQLAEKSERAKKYLGWPLLLLMKNSHFRS